MVKILFAILFLFIVMDGASVFSRAQQMMAIPSTLTAIPAKKKLTLPGYLILYQDEVEVVYFNAPKETDSSQDKDAIIDIVNQVHANGKSLALVFCPQLGRDGDIIFIDCTDIAIFPLIK